MASNNKKTVTIANIIAMVGIAALMLFTYLGHAYMSGGETGIDILWAVAIGLGAALILVFLIRAKGAENDLKRWRVIEYSLLGVYFLFAVATTMLGGIYHFFVVNGQKDELKQVAYDDLSRIQTMFETYESNAREAIEITKTGLSNAVAPGEIGDALLQQFMADKGIGNSTGEVNMYIRRQNQALIGPNYRRLRNAFLGNDSIAGEKADIENTVETWNLLKIHEAATQIPYLTEVYVEALSEMAGNAALPVTQKDWAAGVHTIADDNQQIFVPVEETPRFENALKEASGFSLLGLVAVLVIDAAILLNYLVAYRTSSLGFNTKLEEDGGILLK